MLSERIKKHILFGFNDTSVSYQKEKTIHQLIEEQVERTPDNVAVICEDHRLSYKELNEKSNQLARLLRAKGVKPDEPVGIMVERRPELIIGILGILKAGGAYLPLDPDYPKKRLQYMIKDSGTRIILSQSKFMKEFSGKEEVIDLETRGIFTGEVEDLKNINNPSDLAYVIYTSGSTGKPKGVMVPHQAVNNFILGITEKIPVSEKTIILSVTTFSFDIFVLETLLPLTKGASIILANAEQQQNPIALSDLIRKNNVSLLQTTPSRLKMIISTKEGGSSLKHLESILVGGEPFPKYLLKQLQTLNNNNPRIYNMYGPTETTVWSTMADLTEKKEITIGKPIANTQIYIVDENHGLKPIEEPGELCISGDGLTRGYLKRQELTTEKFVNNPFLSGKKMYKTGDLACWLPDGNIKFFGRIDNQVKIRGFRIELGEIENILSNHVNINEAVITAGKDENEDAYLAAYYIEEKDKIGDKETQITVSGLRTYLSERLPDYMIPSYFIKMKKFPLTPNGKIDRKALPAAKEAIQRGREYECPTNESEERLVGIWQDILSMEPIGINENFFELGGHSLKALIIVLRINKEFNINLTITEFFRRPTIKALSEYILHAQAKTFEAISPIQKQPYYPLSSAQKSIYALQQLDKGGRSYNIPTIRLFEGSLDVKRLEGGIQKIIARHESLRTSFRMIDGEVVQQVHDQVDFQISYIQVQKNNIEPVLQELNRPFDLTKAPLFRVGLIRLDQEKFILAIIIHHIISDGVSIEIITNEISQFYAGKELQQLPVQYRDFMSWKNEISNSEYILPKKEYWLKKYNGEIPVLNMPTDFPRPSLKTYEGKTLTFNVDRKLMNNLKRLASQHGGTLFMILLAAYNILLSKYTNQKDIIIGTITAGRHHADLKDIIGIFVNTLPLRNYIDPEKRFEDFLKNMKEATLEVFENEEYPFEKIIEQLNIPRDPSHHPLFEVLFILQNMEIRLDIEGIKTSVYQFETNTSQFDLILEVTETEMGLSCNFKYCKALFKMKTIERLSEYLINVLKEIVKNPQIKIRDIEILSEKEKQQLIYDLNDTQADNSKDKTILQLFEEQVERLPTNIAAEFEGRQLNYRELNNKANQLACVLRNNGVQPEAIVGIMVKHSFEMIIGILATLKAGGAYLPIEPDYPKDRIEFMLNDSKAVVLITHRNLEKKINFDGTILDIDDQKHFSFSDMTSKPESRARPDNLAYIIYTSGTTGKPKGVMIEHQNLVNYITWAAKTYVKGKKLNFPLFTSFAFDLTVTSIFTPLITGNTIVVYQDTSIEKILEENKVGIVKLTPSHLKLLREQKYPNSNVKTFIIGGEELESGLVLDIYNNFNQQIKIYNEYGPTETTVGCMIHLFNPEYDTNHTVSIGIPSDNVKIYILDNQKKPLPIGLKGEVYISGDGLARGYLQRPELNREKFVLNPFIAGKKMYKTGDLARWRPDGRIEFCGRIDHQVKVRGFRIELGEIESQLSQHEHIQDVVVIIQDDKQGIPFLCAYYTQKLQDQNRKGETELSQPLSFNQLRGYLASTLPDYMIPSYFVCLERLPLTANGKLDRKKLPDPISSIQTDTEYQGPTNKIEAKLVEIWKDVLSVERLGVDDNFFKLGGHSLNAINLVSQINKEFRVDIPLLELFDKPTIKSISECILQAKTSEIETIIPCEKKDYYPVSLSQRGIFILNQFAQEGFAFNSTKVFIIQGKLDEKHLEKVINQLIFRHEDLRASFHVINNDDLVQKVHDHCELKVRIEKLKAQESIEEKIKGFIQPFDLSTPPLMRVLLVNIQPEDRNSNLSKYYLIFDMHHIITDGVSIDILINEICNLYNGNDLQPLNIHYKDFAVWQNKFFLTDEGRKQKDFWVQKFSGRISKLDMPLDFPCNSRKSFLAENIMLEVDKKITDGLYSIAKHQEVTLYMILLAVYNVLLSKYTGQDDIIVGTVVAGRSHSDVQNIIGPFINTLPMRNFPKSQKSFKRFLEEVRITSLEAFENQDYPFDVLLNDLSIMNEVNGNPLFNTMFALQNTSREEKMMLSNNIQLIPYHVDDSVLRVDTFLEIYELNRTLQLYLQYSRELLKKTTAEQLLKNYINILQQVIENENIILQDIKLVTHDLKTVNSNLLQEDEGDFYF